MVLFPHQQSYHFFIVTSTCCPALIYRSWEATWHVYHMSSSRASYWLHYILYKFCISYQNKIRWDFFSYLMCIISCLFIWYVVAALLFFALPPHPLVENISHFCFILLLFLYANAFISSCSLFICTCCSNQELWMLRWSQEFSCIRRECWRLVIKSLYLIAI